MLAFNFIKTCIKQARIFLSFTKTETVESANLIYIK